MGRTKRYLLCGHIWCSSLSKVWRRKKYFSRKQGLWVCARKTRSGNGWQDQSLEKTSVMFLFYNQCVGLTVYAGIHVSQCLNMSGDFAIQFCPPTPTLHLDLSFYCWQREKKTTIIKVVKIIRCRHLATMYISSRESKNIWLFYFIYTVWSSFCSCYRWASFSPFVLRVDSEPRDALPQHPP